MRIRTAPLLTVAVTLLLTTAGCSSAPRDDAASGAGLRTVRPVDGCGRPAWTDPSDRSPERAPARCAPGRPAPDRLTPARKLTIATGTLSAEYVAPLEVAVDKGEFAKEGLDVTLKVLPTPDALPLLAKGDIDALWAAPEAAVVNGVRGGFDIKWVAGNFSPDPKSRSGLWARLREGETAAGVRLAGRSLGTMIGKGSVIAYPMQSALERHGGGLDRIRYRQLGSADVLTALRNGGVDSAWLLDPVWRAVDGDPHYAFLGGQPLGEPLGGLLYGRALLHDDVDAGVALMRAYVRTVNTYFRSAYKSDPSFVTYLSGLTKIDAKTLTATPSLRVDWEIRAGTATRLQQAYAAQGATRAGAPLAESRVVSRAYYEEAVGHVP